MGSSNTCLVLTTGSNVVWFLLHLIGMCLAAGYTYAFWYFAYAIASSATVWSPSLPPFFGLMDKVLFTTMLLFIGSGGLLYIFLLLNNLYKHSEPFRVSRVGRYLARLPGLVIFKRIHEKYLLPTPPPYRKGRLFYLKRVLIRQGSSSFSDPARLSIANTWAVILLLPRLLFLFLISVPLVICTWLCKQWIALLIVSMDSPLLAAWLLVSIVLVPALGYCSYKVLYSWYICVGYFLVGVMSDADDNYLQV